MVAGTQNLIERNLLNGNGGFGLQFCIPGDSCNNTFGRNMARGNGGAVIGPCGACAGAPALFPPNSCNVAVSGGPTEQHLRRQLDPRTSIF